MSEQNDWDVIRRAGIQIDFHAEPLPGWGYAIPVVGCDWHGPYSTKTEALEAALRYLLDRVRKEPVLNRTRSTVDSTQRQIEDLQQRDRLLRRELGPLSRQAVILRDKVPEEVAARIAILEQEITSIHDQIKELVCRTDK
jgi:hypothetical protein